MPFCEREGRRVHYTLTGEGPGIVLLPGIGSGARLFGTLPRRFARAGFTCAAVDPVGLPPSSPLPGPFSFAEAAADALAVCAALGTPAALVGTSLGGKVALQAAATGSETLTALVMLSSAARASARARAVHRAFGVLAEHLDGRRLGAVLAPFLFGATFHDRHPAVVRDILRAIRPDPAARAFLAAQARALDGFDGAALAARVQRPVLCLAGLEDTLTLPAEVEATAALFTRARYEAVRDAGHSLLLESPGVFEAVTAFAREAATPAP